MTVKLSGIFAPMITNFRPGSEDLDLEAFGRNAAAHGAAGVGGLVICGSTGEAALLSEYERVAVLEQACKSAKAGSTILMGCGGESTRQTIQRTKDAKTAGAHAALVVAPHYYSNAMHEAALRTHYTRVADASPLPVVLYNIPKYMHFKLTPTLVAELSQHPNIIGIKDSSGDLELLGGYLASRGEHFTVLTGNGGQIHPAMKAGAKGGIVAVSIFGAELAVAIHDATVRGDDAAAEALQDRMKPLAVTIVGELGVAGVKAAAELTGLAGGPVRGPLTDLDAAGRARVRELLVAGGLHVVG